MTQISLQKIASLLAFSQGPQNGPVHQTSLVILSHGSDQNMPKVKQAQISWAQGVTSMSITCLWHVGGHSEVGVAYHTVRQEKMHLWASHNSLTILATLVAQFSKKKGWGNRGKGNREVGRQEERNRNAKGRGRKRNNCRIFCWNANYHIIRLLSLSI